MSLEAQEVAVRVRLLGGTAFEAEAAGVSKSVEGIGAAGRKVAAENAVSNSAGLTGFLGNTGKALDTMSGKLDRFSKKSLQVGRETAVLSAGASFLIYESVKEAAATEGKFRLLETQAHATLKIRKELEAGGKGMSKFGVDPQEYADALYPIQSVFHNVKTDHDAMIASAKGAAIGHDTLLNATNAMIGGFRSGFKDIHSFSEEMALLDETVGAGKMHLPELTAAFKGSLFPTAASLKVPQRDVLGLLAAATQTGQNPEEYATRFRTTLLKMGGLKGQALAAAKQLGFSKDQMAEEYKKEGGLALILRQIEEGRHRLGETKGNAAISTVFGGSRSAGTIFTALQLGKTYEEIVKRLEGVKGHATLDEHFDQTKGTMTFQLKVLRGQIKETENELGKFFGPPVVSALKTLAGGLQELAGTFHELPKPVKDTLGILLVLTAGLAPVAFLLSGMAAGLRLLLSPLKGLVWLFQAGRWVGMASDLGLIGTRLPGVIGGFGLLGAALVGLYLTLEKGKHPFNAWEEAYHHLFGGYTAQEKEEKAAEKHARDNFLHNRHAADARHRSTWAHSHPHPWSSPIHNPQLKRAVEDLERKEPDRVRKGLPPIEIKLYHKTDLNGKQLALELVRPLEQIQRANHHRK